MELLTYPNSLLRGKSEKIENITDDIITTAQIMAEIMYDKKGVGLAAPQIGFLKQLIVFDQGEGIVTLANPEITESYGSDCMEEGCLCLPGITADIERYEKVNVEAVDLNGKPVSFEAEGYLARIFQHEIDHLNGIIIIDHLSKVKRDLVLKKYGKQQK